VTQFSRRDRAAMTLALECVRETIAVDDDDDVRDDVASSRVRYALDAFLCALPGERADELRMYAVHARKRVNPRLLRARLALALRVFLRADAGDFGRCRTWVCDQEHQPVRPLWCDAPPHEVSR
jgi:hypothetical protein